VNRHGSSVIEFPSALEIVTTRKFDAPRDLVFDVLTQPEHVRHWFAAFEDQVTACSIDLRVGGAYVIDVMTSDGKLMSFSGTYAEVDPPARIVASWLFDGWPEVEAIESTELDESDGVTTMTITLAFRDQAGRDRMTKFDGQESSWDNLEDYLRLLTG
jgi:uncharacterized protein YndB with AHSA1/START domain